MAQWKLNASQACSLGSWKLASVNADLKILTDDRLPGDHLGQRLRSIRQGSA
jgi:hypothetical protein